MNPRVRNVKPIRGYRLEITFSSGEVGVYDCRPLLDFGVFRELKDEAYFRQARAVGGTVVWPHEQDICPDTLYADAKKRRRPKAADSTRTAAGSRKRTARGSHDA